MPTPAPASPTAARAPVVRRLRQAVAWVLGLVLLAGTGSALAVAVYPVVTGGQALAVLTGSMRPGLPVGAMVFTRPVDPADLAVGDVVTFQRTPDAPELVTHRVVAVDDQGGTPVLVTQGDANDAPDLDPVPADAVRGELWFSVPGLGRAAAVLHSPKGVGLLVVLVCGVLAAAPGRPSAEDTVAPSPGAGEVDADSARTVVMAPVDVALLDDPTMAGWAAAHPSLPLPVRPVRLAGPPAPPLPRA
ncbi:hypothetical protein GCM10027261_43250 [Geodermatophilus arenarius]|uniref:Signal peptidase I n=1 Tax=Geodermatophilus arenarius TaxID=1137990 RepID=A0ABV9LPH3_9ACTN